MAIPLLTRRSSLLSPLGGWLLGTTCALCGQCGPALCSACLSRLQPAGWVEPAPPGLDLCVSLVDYEGAGRELVLALKYRNRRQALSLIGHALSSLATDSLSIAGYGQPSLVTWAPTSEARRKRRGFDQARLLAQATAAHLGVPAVALLRRRAGAAQTGAPADQRRRGPSFARSRRGVRGAGPLLIVDDVLTTGSTLRGAAKALQDSGFAPLVGLVLARTALKVTTRRADESN